MQYYTADYVYPIASAPVKDGIVAVEPDGTIAGVINPASSNFTAPASAPKKLDGILLPGFVNAHCHLELSHLIGKSQTGKTLLPFLIDVISLRDSDQQVIDEAISRWDAYMWEQGIQAVGDICNKADTASVKRRSPIRYHSFVEMFDFMQGGERAAAAYEQYHRVYDQQAGPASGNAKTAVPHAPYSVSDELYALINGLNATAGDEPTTVSIHNEETPAENELFRTKTGGFLPFFAGFNASLDHFAATGKSAIHHVLQRLDPTQRALFVHNTLTDREGIEAATAWGRNGVYWATCPNANLYIENRLPRYDVFLDTDAKVCVGTDSLTSNWQLSILEELRTISRYQSYVPFNDLLTWATLNGAEALGFADDLGSLETGKKPGLLNLRRLAGTTPAEYRITAETSVYRLV